MTSKTKRAQIVLQTLQELFPVVKSSLNYSNNWEFLVAVILSAQCTDKMVNKVTEKLFKKYLSLNDYVNANVEKFKGDIKSIGLYRAKSKNIIATAKIISQKHNGEIPKLVSELIKLPGVGRKTANVISSELYGNVEGIAVDTHVKRLSKIFGLTKQENPLKIEKDLMNLLPKKEWRYFTLRMIEYGRNYNPELILQKLKKAN